MPRATSSFTPHVLGLLLAVAPVQAACGGDDDGAIDADAATDAAPRPCGGAGLILYDHRPDPGPLSESNRYTIRAVCPDGTGAHRILPGSDAHDHSPNWHPSGEHLVFVRHQGGVDRIMRVAREGGDATEIVADGLGKGNPLYSPDGALLAYTSDQPGGGPAKIMIADADGRNPRRLTTSSATDPDAVEGFFSWTPDSRRVVLRFGPDGGRRIWTVQLDGFAGPLLGEVESFHPVVSPDGAWLLFSHLPPGVPVRTWRMRPDGREASEVTFTDPVTASILPCWAPDGQRFVFWGQAEDTTLRVAPFDPPRAAPPLLPAEPPAHLRTLPGCWR